MAQTSGHPVSEPRVSAVIVTWHQPDLTARSVESLQAQADGHVLEIVIVENEGTRESGDWFRRRFPDALVVVNARNEGFAGGVASGIAAASGEVIVLLNNDAVAAPGFLSAGMERMATEPATVAAVAARIELEGEFAPVADPGTDASHEVLVGVHGELWRRVAKDAAGVRLLNSTGVVLTRSGNCHDRDWLRPVNGLPAPDETSAEYGEPFAFSGGAVFLRAAVVAELGGFDTSFFMYYEDVDLAWRMRLAGYRVVYEPGAVALHRHAASSGHDSPLIRAYGMRNRTLTMLKNAPAAAAAAVLVRSLARAAVDLSAITRHHRPYLDGPGWRLYLGSVLRHLPAAAGERRRTSRARRRRVFTDFAR